MQWWDPLQLAAGVAGLTGLEALRAIASGDQPPPPIAGLIRSRLVRVDPGEVVFHCTPDESMYNPLGVVHGGLVCTLLDSALGCAVHTTLAAGVGYTSLEIKVSYLRAVRADEGDLVATGRVVRPGSKAAFAEGEAINAAGKVVATATSTFAVFPLA